MVCPNYTPNLPVTQVQMWLRALARSEGIHPLPPVDGVYSEATAEAVRRFQAAHGLPVTGTVDFATWSAIHAAYGPVCTCESAPSPLYVQCPETHLGSMGSYLFILQAMLNTLSPHFGNFPAIAYTGEYDTDTRDLICVMQRAAGIPDNGDLDRFTWNALAALYNSNQGRIPLEWRRSM